MPIVLLSHCLDPNCLYVHHGDGSPPWLAEDLPGQHLHLLSLPLGNPVSYIFFFTLVVRV